MVMLQPWTSAAGACAAWRILGRVGLRRPRAIPDALSFIVMHKAMYDYTESILDGLVAPALSEAPRTPGVPIELAMRTDGLMAGSR
jgi:hypothetical protein